MKRRFDDVLDECLALLQSGQATLDECLARYPDQAADLGPLLEMAVQVHHVPPPVPSPVAFDVGKRRMLQALAEKKRRQLASPSPLSRYAGRIAALFERKERPAVYQRISVSRLVLAASVALVLLVAGGLLLQSWLSTAVAQSAALADVSGIVEVLPAGSDTWQMAAPGTCITVGDRIRTGESSAVTLAFFDGSVTSLEAQTELTVSQLSAQRDGRGKVIVLHQWMGHTYNRVQRLLDPASRFEIETPTAVTAVRGTVFVVDVAFDGTTQVTVGEGLVEVTAQGTTVAVRPGQMTTVQPEQPPAAVMSAPIPLPPEVAQPSATPQPPGLTRTPQPPGLTRTPQPPGLTRTPQPPGQTRTPQPPGLTKTPHPPGLTRTPQPPGQTRTPQPPGLTRTPQPPGQARTPHPPKPTRVPKPTKAR